MNPSNEQGPDQPATNIPESPNESSYENASSIESPDDAKENKQSNKQQQKWSKFEQSRPIKKRKLLLSTSPSVLSTDIQSENGLVSESSDHKRAKANFQNSQGLCIIYGCSIMKSNIKFFSYSRSNRPDQHRDY